MKTMKEYLLKKFRLSKIDPNVVLLILVVMFFVLLYAIENIVKLTLLPQ